MLRSVAAPAGGLRRCFAATPCASGGTGKPSGAARPQQAPPQQKTKLDTKRILCVASCKGGVGKSSVALNLAAAFALRGQRVGILDMDIYGPSLPSLLPPTLEKPTGNAQGLITPLLWDGGFTHPIQYMSYGYLKPGEFAAIRGPMVAGIAGQLMTGVAWRGLDTLVVDMPPGTGDVHLTVSQQAPIDAAVMVTTPQQLALVDVEKGIKMFDKVGIPTIAIVENMSYLDCGCGTRHHIFGEGGGQRLAETFGIQSFHQFPLDPTFNSASKQSNDGPLLAQSCTADNPIAQAVRRLAEGLDIELAAIEMSRGKRTKAIKSDEGRTLTVLEGRQSLSVLPSRKVRLECKCAHCVDEWTGAKRLDPATVPDDVVALSVEAAGRYAVHVEWSDKHSSICNLQSLKTMQCL